MNTPTAKPAHQFRPAADTAQHTADSLADGWQSRTLQEAYDEVAREIGVRERCFPKWITEGKVSSSDAKDRLQRLIKVAEFMKFLVDNPTISGG